MRNYFGLGDSTWRKEGATGMLSVPASREERTRFCWSVLCWLLPAEPTFLLHNGDKQLQCTSFVAVTV